jgi:hypothetical protein
VVGVVVGVVFIALFFLLQISLSNFNLLAREFYIQILAHSVCKM